jgi:hypothetical protein
MIETAGYAGTLLVTGFVFGLRHAFDADHIAAMSALVSGSSSLKRSMWRGVVWGAGHTATLLVVGLAVLVFKVAIPAQLEAVFETAVGIMLVGLGAAVLLGIFGGENKVHVHPATAESHSSTYSFDGKAFAVGALHGLAGSAAIMLIVLTTARSIHLGLAYIIVFGLGSILGMLVFSGAIAIPLRLSVQNRSAHATLRVLAGLASIAIGILVISRFVM